MARARNAPKTFRLPTSPWGTRRSRSPAQGMGMLGQSMAPLAAGASAGAYAVLHSLLLTERAEAAAHQAFGAAGVNWYRLAYNVLAVGLLAVHDRMLARLPDHSVYALRSPWSWLVRAVGLSGFVGLAACLRLTDAATFVGPRQSARSPGLFHPRCRRRAARPPGWPWLWSGRR